MRQPCFLLLRYSRTSMSCKPGSLLQTIEGIRWGNLLLTHTQRLFLWATDQMRRLFDSLMWNCPIRTFLLSRTKDAIYREFAALTSSVSLGR